MHGDDKGLRFPWRIAPLQVAIVPVIDDAKIMAKAEALKKEISEFASVEIDRSEKSAGEKFNYWEMKGVPVRIDIGLKDLEAKKLTVFRRDLDKKEQISEKEIMNYLKKAASESGINLMKQADKIFEGRIADAKNESEIKKAIEKGMIARVNFCSIEMDGAKCAEIIEKEIGASVRGTMLKKEKVSGKCAICGKPAKEVVYIARAY